MSLNELLLHLSKQGCYPCVSCRGEELWRAHVNATGNSWADANTPYQALKRAVEYWENIGKPMDGYASDSTREI